MKILILAYDFPPLPSVGGFRPYSWYKFFPEAGVYPVVITRKWEKNGESVAENSKDEIERIETEKNLLIRLPHQNSLKDEIILKHGLDKKILLRRILTLSEILLKYRFLYFDGKSYLYNYADYFLSKNKVDCILVTGEPFILFKYGADLSEKYNIPWFGDYRDGWSTNHTRPKGFLWQLLKYLDKTREKRITSTIQDFSSVSSRLVSDIENVISKKGIVISNGVDLDLVKSISEGKQTNEKFVIVFTGTIYEEQLVQKFLTAYENFLNGKHPKNILVKFIGITKYLNENVSKIVQFSRRFPENLIVLPRMSQRESITEQKNADLLLNFIVGVQSEGMIGAKTYEYLAIGKPILVIPTAEEKNPPLFPNRNFQYFAHNIEGIELLLEQFYNKFKNGEDLTTDITADELYQISRKKQAIVLAEYLKSTIAD